MSYRGGPALVTGGLGFIASNLALRLAAEGADVTVVDPLIPGCGGNPFNIEPAGGKIRWVREDIGNPDEFREELARAEVVFNLAGEISHIHSVLLPERDLEINTVAQLKFLDACRRWNRGVRIVYAGTRQVYGVPEYLPVDERHPVHPVDFNGVHKYAATMYHMMLSRCGEVDACVLRLTNVYGPRMALDVPCQGFLSTYLRCALFGRNLEVFGTGGQLRDPVYVDDVVDAFLLAGSAEKLRSSAYNVGGPDVLSVKDIAAIMSRLGKTPPPLFREFPPERKAIDIGSYYTETSLIRTELGWQPSVRFEDGMQRTLDYYKQRLARYIDPDNPHPCCKLSHAGERRPEKESAKLA